jgi:hypothetical protein
MLHRNRTSQKSVPPTTRGADSLRSRLPHRPFELLERRELLSAAIVNAIPSVIPPSSGGQSMFAPGVTRQTITPGGTGTFSQFQQFALDGAGFSENVSFQFKPAGNQNGNGGLALYDENGNLVTKADPDPANGRLTADVQTRRRYILGVFVGVPGIPFNYDLVTTTGPQLTNPVVRIDPASGVAPASGANPEDLFSTPTDVDYYPLDLANAGTSGTVVVTPTGPDVKVSATLFRRTDASQAWERIDAKSDATGAAVTLTPAPPANGTLSDGQYLLAVAPLGMNTAAGSYTVEVNAGPVLGPATVNSVTATDLSTLAPLSPNVAGATRSASIPSGGDAVYKFRAPAGGPVNITLHADAFQPVLSLYNASGLADVASRTAAGDATITYNATAGEQLAVRVGDAGNNNGGAFNLGVQGQYGTTAVALQAPFTSVGPVQVGPDQTASFFRVQTNPGADVLLVEAQPSGPAIGARLVVVGQNMVPVEINGAAGQKVLLPATIAGLVGPFDIYVSGSAGAGSVTLRMGQFDIPDAIDAADLAAVKPDLQGDFATGAIGAGGYGAPSGVKYHQLPIAPGQPAPTVTVQGGNGSMPLLAVYGEDGGLLKLTGFTTPSPAGTATAEGSPVGDRVTAIAAFSLNFDGGGTNVFTVNGPAAAPVPIGMVPEPVPSVPPGPDPAQFLSKLSIRELKLGNDFEQDFWSTRLPTNMVANPVITFTPKTAGGALAAKVTVYRDNNGTLSPIGSLQTTPGTSGTLTLSPFSSLQNAKVAFLVEPLAGGLGDGIYTLEMIVPTTNPHPFEVTEPAWKVFGTNPTNPPAGIATLPLGETIRDVVQNQFGNGSAEGQFVSSQPYNTGAFGNIGSIDVYRFWSVNNGPLTVRTVAIDETVNTNIKVYRAHFDNSGSQVVQYLEQIPNVYGSFDWMPADRTTVDAQVIVNDYETLQYGIPNNPYRDASDFNRPSGGMYFVVVKNQEGSLGRYRVEVDAPNFPQLGGISATTVPSYVNALANQAAYLPQDGNALQLKLNYTDSFNEFVGMFPVQMPAFHTGTLSVTSSSKWDFALFDSQGNALPGTETDGVTTSATFTVPAGSRTVYLRVKEQAGTATANASAVITLAADTTLPAASPAATLPTTPVAVLLPVDPYADAKATRDDQGNILTDNRLHDSFAAAGQTKVYTFRAPATRPVKFNVVPDVAGAMNLQWAVYVNGTLRAWNLTRQSNGAFDALTTTLDLHLPAVTDPTPSDTAAFEDLTSNVQVWVRSVGAPAAGRGGFTIEVDSDTALPTVFPAGDLAFNPIQLPDPIIDRTILGNTFYRLAVPDHTTGGLTVEATPNNTGIVFGSQQLRWELYGPGGQKLSSGVASTDVVTHKATFTMPEATNGMTYFLRLGVSGDATLTLDVKLRISMIKQFGNKPAATMPLLAGEVIRRTSPPPSGIFTTYHTTILDNANPNVKESYAFWVQNGGVAHFDAFFNPGNNVNATDVALAVYRMTADSGEFATYQLQLVDYTNSFGMVDGRYSLDVYLDPGAYVLKAIRASIGFVSSHVNWRLPAYTPEEITLDPNAGSNATLTNLLNIDDAEAAVNPLESFRTHFYRVVAPGAAQGEISATAINLATDDFGFEDRNAFLSMWQADAGQPGGYRSFTNGAGTGMIDPPAVNNTTIFPSTVADAGEVFFLALNRNGLSSKIGVGVTFDVPQSGVADYVVDPIQLSPDNGQTKVTITVHNRGYAAAGVSNSLFAYTNTSALVTTTTEAVLQQLPLGPLGSVTITLPWLPTRPADQVFFTADYDHKVTEYREDNNDESVALSTVDAHRPTITLSLSDAAMDGNPAANVWGRYISGVDARTNILFDAKDPDGRLYMIRGFKPYEGLDHGVTGGQFYFFELDGGADPVTYNNYNFGRLFQTQGNNPNHFTAYVVDEYGLVSDELVKTIQVVPTPEWLSGDSSSVSFDPATHRYKLNFHADVLRYEATINQLVHAEIPFIGDKNNLVLGEVMSDGWATLNPADQVELPLKAHAQVTVLGEDVLNESWDGSANPTDHFSISTLIHLDSTSLEADQFELTFRLTDLPLFNFQSPEIPLFAYGIPDVASINANLQFSLNATLDAALTLALRPDGQGGINFGLATPTFIRPEITAGLAFSGEIEVLGFDIASLSGAVNFKLGFAYGLDTTDVFVPFLDFFNEAELNVDGELWGSIEATVLGFEGFNYEFPHLLMDFSSGGTVATAMAAPIIPDMVADAPAPIVHGGNEVIDQYAGHESPNIVIDPANGNAMYVQAVDTDDTAAGYFGGLRYARRVAGGWSSLQPLAAAGSVANPLLALSHDGPGSPTVLAYQAFNGAGGPVGKTRGQFLAGQDLRYRYFDGTNWGAEQSLTSDGLYDNQHAMAFNGAGKGALVWVRNKNASPVTADGEYLRGGNEVMVSMWDAVTHTWGAPIPLTNDATGDSLPSVYVAQDGKVYVAWVRDTAGGNEIAYRTFANGAWADAATLPVAGLPAGGRFRSIAIGGDASGKITTMVWYSVTDPDVSDATAIASDSRLYARTTAAAGFGQAAAAIEVDADGNYSGLAVTNTPDGSLLAYWQNSDGQINDVYSSKLAANGTWSQPVRLTAGSEIEQAPSLAADADGSYAVVYEKRAAATIPEFPNQVPQPTPVYGQPLALTVAGEVGTVVLQNRPELSFARQMFFPAQDQAAQGGQAVAKATVVNTGLADATVLLEFLEYPVVQAGEPVVLGSQQIFLKAGSSTELSHAFLVKPGEVTYGFRVSPMGSSEALSGTDNVSTATLTGKVDIAVVSVTPSVADPKAGQAITLNVVVKNLSSVATGSFGLGLFEDDPTTPNYVKKLINSTTVSLAAGETKTLSFAYTVPAAGGSFILTAVADPADAIAEATEFNNTAGTVIAVRPDARVGELAPGVTARATVLNFTGVNNVRVDAVVRNDGDAPVAGLKVRLRWSLKDGDYVVGETKTIALLLPGQSAEVNFVAAGLAGINRYLVVVDPDNERPDLDRSNNVGDTSVFIQGLPDLRVLDFTLSQVPAQGLPLTLNATLQNLGIDDAKNVEVEVYARPLSGPGPSGQFPATGVLVGKVKVAELKALSGVNLVIELDTSKLLGAVELSLVVDPRLQIVETTDLNNAVTKAFTFVKKASRVEGRRVFYNNSKFDGNDPKAGTADDGAIATDKAALLPGRTATIANYTNYTRGINGIMIDISDLPQNVTLAAEDFAFKVGTSPNTAAWLNAPVPTGITIRRGAGANGSDRVTLIWADGAIVKTWLQVTVKATARTGLTAPDVFYFGNLPGETGNSAAVAAVEAMDVVLTRTQIGTSVVGVTSRFDFNRDGRVNVADLALARSSQFSSIPLLGAPALASASAVADVVAGRFSPTLRQSFASERLIDAIANSVEGDGREGDRGSDGFDSHST